MQSIAIHVFFFFLPFFIYGYDHVPFHLYMTNHTGARMHSPPVQMQITSPRESVDFAHPSIGRQITGLLVDVLDITTNSNNVKVCHTIIPALSRVVTSRTCS